MELNCRGCKAPLPLAEENSSKVIICEWCRATNPNPLFRESQRPVQQNVRTTPPPQKNVQQQQTLTHLKIASNHNVGAVIVLSLITFGIYTIFWHSRLSKDINTIASHHDGKRTWNGALVIIISLFTAAFVYGIPTLIWHHLFTNRIGAELRRRRINYRIGARDFWIWCVLGAFILIGPIVYAYKICRAMNALIMDYNQYG